MHDIDRIIASNACMALSSSFHGSHTSHEPYSPTAGRQHTQQTSCQEKLPLSCANRIHRIRQTPNAHRPNERGQVDNDIFIPPSLSSSKQILSSSPSMTKSHWKHKKIEFKAAGGNTNNISRWGRTGAETDETVQFIGFLSLYIFEARFRGISNGGEFLYTTKCLILCDEASFYMLFMCKIIPC